MTTITRRGLLPAAAALTLGATLAGSRTARAAAPLTDLNLTVGSASAPEGEYRPAVWLVPHQDDEVLTLGPGLETHQNRWNVVVLATDGRSSGVRQWMGVDHVTFSAARDREFHASCRALGADRVYAEGGYDGGLTLIQARAIVTKWVDRFPDASFKTMSYLDSSPDHRNLGIALREAWLASGRRLDARFYLKRDDANRAPAGVMRVQGGRMTLNAAAEYALVDEAAGRYGIGYRSVGRSFDALRADPSTLCHVPA